MALAMYQPEMKQVIGITNSNPAVVSVWGDHDYITGTVVRLYVPDGFGMVQANGLTGKITVINTWAFSIDIDTIPFDIFVIPAVFPQDQQSAQVVPVGEDNDMLTAATDNILN